MKLLHLTSYFFPEYTGTATRLYNLISRLPHKVSLYTLDRLINGTLITERVEDINNIQVTRFAAYPEKIIRSSPAWRRLYAIYLYYYMAKRMIGLNDQEKWSIVHAHNVLPFGQAAKELSRAYQCPFVFEQHGISEESVEGLSKAIQIAYLQRETTRLIRCADHVITLTNALKDRICTTNKVSGERVTVVPNGVDVNMFVPDQAIVAKAQRLKEQLNIDGKIVMYAGILDKINGLVDLISAIPEIIRKQPAVFFIFIGHGPEANLIYSLSQEYRQIKLLSMISYEEMPLYYQMCDLFVIPRPSTISAETITPLKLLEAMAMQKPVLGSNVGGISEVIRDGQNGYLFEQGNMRAFSNLLLEVLQNDNEEIGRRARETVQRDYTWDRSSKILEGVYEALL